MRRLTDSLRRRGFAGLAAAALVLTSLTAAGGCGGSSTTTALHSIASVKPQGIENAGPQLKDIYAQANQLLPGGLTAYRARLTALAGTPVVVNKWASWCGPCAAEMPLFQRAAKHYGAKIAFLGADANDSKSGARARLNQTPLPYPSYSDPKLEISAALRQALNTPATGFYNRAGKLVYVHVGQYRDTAALSGDIARYADAR